MIEHKHHPIFSKFPRFKGIVPDNFNANHIGYLQHLDFDECPKISAKGIYEPKLPFFEEEYFEWIDLLESIDSCRNSSFIMLDIGAGFGRWAGCGGVAARSRGMPFFLGMAEGEPTYVNWIKKQMEYNKIPRGCYKVFDCAVGTRDGHTLFSISRGFKGKAGIPGKWFGQRILKKDLPLWKTKLKYCGHPIIKTLNGSAIKVKLRKLSTILAEFPHQIIDYCCFDIQGQEFRVIQDSIELLNARVKCLHIGTHNHQIEKNLRALISSHRWKLKRDFPCLQENQTEYGKLYFQDGVQTWTNQRF